MAFSNSAVNPLIYAIFNQQFQKGKFQNWSNPQFYLFKLFWKSKLVNHNHVKCTYGKILQYHDIIVLTFCTGIVELFSRHVATSGHPHRQRDQLLVPGSSLATARSPIPSPTLPRGNTSATYVISALWPGHCSRQFHPQREPHSSSRRTLPVSAR